VEPRAAGFSDRGRLAAGFGPGPCEQPALQTWGAWALRSFRSQAVRFSGRISRRCTIGKTLAAAAPQAGQAQGAPDSAIERSCVKGPHARHSKS